MGSRLRGIFGTSASSCSFHPGWKQEIAGLVGWVTDRLRTRFAGFVSIAPSLGVLLSFAQQRIAQPSVAEISTTPSTPQARLKAARRSRLSKGLAPTSSYTTVANVTETPQPTDFSTERNTESPVLNQSGGPQLLHRGAATPAKGKQQTVIPIDDASDQVSKAGDHDHNQALQQTATAAESKAPIRSRPPLAFFVHLCTAAY